MSFKNLSILIVIAFCFFLVSCAESQEEGLDLAQVRQTVEEADQKFIKAVMSADVAAAMAMCTEDTMLLPPNGDLIQGKENVEAFWKATWSQMTVKDFKVDIVDLYGSGDVVYEVGTYILTIPLEREETVEERGKYVVIWKQMNDGKWKKHLDIWNSSMPVQQ